MAAAVLDVLFAGYVGERVAGTVSLIRHAALVAVVDPGMVPDRSDILGPPTMLEVVPEAVTVAAFEALVISHGAASCTRSFRRLITLELVPTRPRLSRGVLPCSRARQLESTRRHSGAEPHASATPNLGGFPVHCFADRRRPSPPSISTAPEQHTALIERLNLPFTMLSLPDGSPAVVPTAGQTRATGTENSPSGPFIA